MTEHGPDIDTKPSHLAPWSALSEWDKGADRAIARMVIQDRDQRPVGGVAD